MYNRLVSTVFFGTGIAVALIAAPAVAADDIESKVQVCAACHGANGVPADPKSTPTIWGQQANYLYKELHDYHSGDRANPIMAPVAKGFSLEELRAIANYFAAKSWPAKAAAAAPAGASQTAAAAPGAPPEGIDMCKACHQPNFEGGAPAPRLAGLSYDYLIAAMNNFADGKRTNNLDMPGFMRALTESQREAMAHYLSSL